MRFRLAVFFVVAGVVTLAAQATRQVRLFNTVAPPETLEEEISRVSLIVFGQVQGQTQKLLGTPEFQTPAIEHQVNVLQVLKGDARPGDVIRVTQPGGVVVVGGTEIVVDDRRFRVFKDGQRLVLFLQEHAGWGLVPAWGQASAFTVVNDTVVIPEAARHSPARRKIFGESTSQPLAQFISLVRSKVR